MSAMSLRQSPLIFAAYLFALFISCYCRQGGMHGAFILAIRRDSSSSLLTLRCMIVPGYWNERAMLEQMKQVFRR